MATNPNAAANTESKAADKAKTVIDDMAARRVFADAESFGAYLTKCATEYADFASYPIAAPGLSEDGTLDPEIYTDAMNIAVAVLTQRGDGPNSSSVKAIVIYPSPKLDAILSDAPAREWLEGIIAKEINHVAVRQLRKAENIADVTDQMPTSLADYVTSNRESAGGILQSYEDLWKPIKKAVGSKFRAFALQNLSKKELRRGMESASYAKETYPTLEDRGNNKSGAANPSLFVLAAQLGIVQAKKLGLDPAIFERWLENRNDKVIEITEDEDDISLDDLTAAFTTEEAPATPADGEGTGDTDQTGTDSTDPKANGNSEQQSA